MPDTEPRYCIVEGCPNLARQKTPGTRGRRPSRCEEHAAPSRTESHTEAAQSSESGWREDGWLPYRPRAAARPEPEAESPEAESPEVRPKGPDHSPVSWARERIREAAPKAPRPTGRRVPTDAIWATIWSGGGMALQQTPWYPVGRILTYQSMAAGPIMDDAIRGTLADRLVQPIARAGNRGKAAGVLIGPPLIVGLIGSHPALAPALAPMLRMMLASMLDELAPIAAEKAKKEAKTAAILAEQFPELGIDPVQALFDLIFAPPAGVPTEAPV